MGRRPAGSPGTELAAGIAAARVFSSCAAQGLPVKVADRALLGQVVGRRSGAHQRTAPGAPDRREPVGVEPVVASSAGVDDDVIEDGRDDRVLPGRGDCAPTAPVTRLRYRSSAGRGRGCGSAGPTASSRRSPVARSAVRAACHSVTRSHDAPYIPAQLVQLPPETGRSLACQRSASGSPGSPPMRPRARANPAGRAPPRPRTPPPGSALTADRPQPEKPGPFTRTGKGRARPAWAARRVFPRTGRSATVARSRYRRATLFVRRLRVSQQDPDPLRVGRADDPGPFRDARRPRPCAPAARRSAPNANIRLQRLRLPTGPRSRSPTPRSFKPVPDRAKRFPGQQPRGALTDHDRLRLREPVRSCRPHTRTVGEPPPAIFPAWASSSCLRRIRRLLSSLSFAATAPCSRLTCLPFDGGNPSRVRFPPPPFSC